MTDKYDYKDGAIHAVWIHRGMWEAIRRNILPAILWCLANFFRAYCQHCERQSVTRRTYRVDVFRDQLNQPYRSEVWCSLCVTKTRLVGNLRPVTEE